ncbi:alpha/beta hydrolase [Nonomuraea sp. NPDC048881]|uniref:alpha/beta fold hydrolase n=1 Tax=Nonomuraea sp. NPDC048881 TaxID=3155030 RepID=UPI0033E2871D
MDREPGDFAEVPVVMVHGGPGVPDHLAPVAGVIDDLRLVRRYDQRGTGGSCWEGEHTIARHLDDLALSLDAWGHDQAVLKDEEFESGPAAARTGPARPSR